MLLHGFQVLYLNVLVSILFLIDEKYFEFFCLCFAEDLVVAGSFQSENPSTSFKTFPTRIGKQELYKPYNEDSTNVEPPAAGKCIIQEKTKQNIILMDVNNS